MFTGLIETTGEIRAVEHRGAAVRLAVESDLPTDEIGLGESIAVDGVCLTVCSAGQGRLEFDVIPETLACTTLGRRDRGARVNLERSLRLGDRLGGHLVQGHVDGMAEVVGVRTGDDHRVRFDLDSRLERYIAFKGSIALNGVSLTVAAREAAWAEVALIPETLNRTNLGLLASGDRVNVEVDLIARYLERLTGGTGEGYERA